MPFISRHGIAKFSSGCNQTLQSQNDIVNSCHIATGNFSITILVTIKDGSILAKEDVVVEGGNITTGALAIAVHIAGNYRLPSHAIDNNILVFNHVATQAHVAVGIKIGTCRLGDVAPQVFINY